MAFTEAKKNATEAKKNATIKASGLLRSARKSVGGIKDSGKELSASVLENLKLKANKYENYFNGGSSSSSARAARAAGLSPQKNSSVTEELLVDRLCALGVSAAAARHALRRCGGRVEPAGIWLLDEANADEILAAELAAREADPFHVGMVARISGLRGAAQLNGTRVTLRQWDDESGRWVVQAEDGSMKAIRPKHLNPHEDNSVDDAAKNAERKKDFAESATASARSPDKLSSQAAAMTPPTSPTRDVDTVLEKLIESEPVPRLQKFEVPSFAATEDEDAKYAALEKQLQESQERIAAQENLMEKRAAELEHRESALMESQARWRDEAKAEAQQVRHLEEREEILRSSPTAASSSLAAEVSEGDPDKSAEVRAHMEDWRSELAELQAKALSAAKIVEDQQESSRQQAEERELRLLEAEEEHIHIQQLLEDEQDRLNRERRKVMMLQRSLIVAGSAAQPAGAGGYGDASPAVEPGTVQSFTMNDGDDSSRGASPMKDANPENGNEVQAADGDQQSANRSSSKDADDVDEVDGEEVWDLDWSALNAQSAVTPEAGMSPSTNAALRSKREARHLRDARSEEDSSSANDDIT